MCQAAAKTAYAVLKGVEPTVIQLLTLTGVASSPEGVAAITAFNAALTALENWQSGTPSAEVIQLLNDFVTVFNTLPLPTIVKTLANIIVAGITTVIGIVTANSPAPVVAGAAVVEDAQAVHQAAVAHDTAVAVHALVPGIKLSRFHSPETQYRNAWNKEVDAVATIDETYDVLKQ